MKREKEKIKRIRITLLFCAGLVIILNSIGVGYGQWSSVINVDGHIESGNVEVVYDDCSIINEEMDNKDVQIQVCASDINDEQFNCDNKKLDIIVQNALPGDSVKVRYTVKNIGTLPVNCDPISDINGPVNINIESLGKIDPPTYKSLDNKLILDNMLESNYKSGIITITVGQIEESNNYNYSFKLAFNNNSWDDALDLSIMVKASDKFAVDDKDSKDNTGLINNNKEITNAGSPNAAETSGIIKSAGSDDKNSNDNADLINNDKEIINTGNSNVEASSISTIKDTSAGSDTGIIDNKN